MKKMIPRQKIWLTFVLVVNLALWLIPSNVVELIARDHQTLLGRYSRQHFTWIVALLLITPITLYIDWSTGVTYKRRWFQVLATLLFLMPALGLVDFLIRTPDTAHYVRDTLAYHHPPNSTYTRNYVDKPQAYRTYPNAPAGYPPIECTLTTDARGFRNAEAVDQCDIVVLGDSFAEGSGVSDENVWPVRLAELSGKSVYNLGVSGYDPFHYLESLREFGLPLKPQLVLCMLYEGNDFRSAKSDRKRKKPSLSKNLNRYFKQSPIAAAIDELLIETFAPIGSDWAVAGIELLDWLPMRIPDTAGGKYYTFAPKQLRDLYDTADAFAVDQHWLNPRGQLAKIHELCKASGAELLLIYSPLKAHVVIPAAAKSLPAKKVRDFMALRYKRELPKADDFLANLLERVDSRESVVQEWCNREGIEFLSLTPPLREAAMNGTQVFFTYDQHWTPDGHGTVAEVVDQYLRSFESPE